MTSLAGLESLRQIGGFVGNGQTGRVQLTSNPVLADVSAIGPAIAGVTDTYIDVQYNDSLPDFTGWEAAESIKGLYVRFNDGLTTLSGLDGLVEIRNGFTVHGNPSLQSLSGLESVQRIGPTFNIIANNSLILGET